MKRRSRKISKLVISLTPDEVNTLGDLLSEGLTRFKRNELLCAPSTDTNKAIETGINVMGKINLYLEKAIRSGTFDKKTLQRMGILVDKAGNLA